MVNDSCSDSDICYEFTNFVRISNLNKLLFAKVILFIARKKTNYVSSYAFYSHNLCFYLMIATCFFS